MSYTWQSRLFSDSGALFVTLVDSAVPLADPRYEEWATDSRGFAYVTYAPAKLPVTARRSRQSCIGNISLAFTPSGVLYVTDGSAKAATDEIYDSVRVRQDGVLYVKAEAPVARADTRRNKGWTVDGTGAMYVGGLSLLLNFADLGSGAVSTATSLGTAAPTFTRATAGAAKLSTGLWKLDVASGTARYSYNGMDTTVTTTGGYLAEGARTNSCLQSRDLTNAAWTKSNLTTAKTSTGIDGVANSCTRCTASAGNGTALQAITLASAAKAFGVWIKRVTGSGEVDITFDNGSTWTNITAQINSVTFTLVQATQTLANPTVGIRLVTNTDAVDVDVCQLEDGAAFSSTPIPTTAGAVTRNADLLTYATTGWYAATGGTIFVSGQFTSIDAGNYTLASINDTTANNHIWEFQTGGTGAHQVRDGGVNQCNITIAGVTANVAQKYAGAFVANDFQFARNGTLGTADVSGTIPAVTRLEVGSDAGTLQTFGTISRIAAYNVRQPDVALQRMTA